MKVKAAILSEINAPLIVDEVEPANLEVGQVLVKVLASGICGAQLQEIAGNKNNASYVPHLLGHEGAGIVEDVGLGVTKVKKGDKVVMHWRKGEGIEADFPSYVWQGKRIRSGKVTTFSEYSICSENRLTSVPHDTPNELIALLGCGLSTALGTINSEADVKIGESVLIVGAGGLGVNLIKAARLVSACPIMVADIHEHKRELCESLGAHLYINSAKDRIQDEMLKIGIKAVDVIIDTSANKRAIEDTIPLLSGSGRYVFVGQPKPGESIEIRDAVHLFGGNGKRIMATQGGRFSPAIDIPRYIKLYKAGLLDIENIISHRIKIDGINDAVDLVRQGHASRVLIEM